jgi:hypothetical protein
MFCVYLNSRPTIDSRESHDAARRRGPPAQSLTLSLALPSQSSVVCGGAAAARLQSKCAPGGGGAAGGAPSARGPAAPRGTRGRGKARFSSFSSSGYGDIFATLPRALGRPRAHAYEKCVSLIPEFPRTFRLSNS